MSFRACSIRYLSLSLVNIYFVRAFSRSKSSLAKIVLKSYADVLSVVSINKLALVLVVYCYSQSIIFINIIRIIKKNHRHPHHHERHHHYYFIINNFFFRNESIGVTTGRAFCGVVGHRDRHEYTGKTTLLLSANKRSPQV